MRNITIYGTIDLVNRFVEALERIAPPTSSERSVSTQAAASGFDARIDWTVFREKVTFDVEVKVVAQRSRDAVRRLVDGRPSPGGTIPVLVSPFLSAAVRDELAAAGWSYWDTTGNLLIQSEQPVTWVREMGAQRDPEPDLAREKLRSLKGRAASKLMVHLLTQGRAASVRELARETDVSAATASRVVELLREEELLTDADNGPIVLADRMRAAKRWTQDYSFAKTFAARRYFSISGAQIALERIRSSNLDYALTGVQAAGIYLGGRDRITSLPSNETWLYVSDLEAIERTADLVPDARQGNLLVAEVEAAFFTRETQSERIARPWRIVGDLLSAEGRPAALGQDLGELLMQETLS